MTTLQTPIEMQRPRVVRFGAGQVDTLTAWLEASGATRPFVVADKVNAARLDILGLREPALFGDVKPEPDLPNLEAAVAGRGLHPLAQHREDLRGQKPRLPPLPWRRSPSEAGPKRL